MPIRIRRDYRPFEQPLNHFIQAEPEKVEVKEYRYASHARPLEHTWVRTSFDRDKPEPKYRIEHLPLEKRPPFSILITDRPLSSEEIRRLDLRLPVEALTQTEVEEWVLREVAPYEKTDIDDLKLDIISLSKKTLHPRVWESAIRSLKER